MKEGLNIAYLNGAEGYKKIVLGSQGNEGGNEGGNTGGGNEGGGESLKYYKVLDTSSQVALLNFCTIANATLGSVTVVLPAGGVLQNLDDETTVNSIAFLMDVEMSNMFGDGFITIQEMLEKANLFSNLTEITKEEFYNLE